MNFLRGNIHNFLSALCSKRAKAPLLAALLLAPLLAASCAFDSYNEAHTQAVAFIVAVSNNQPDQAFSLLTKDARAKLGIAPFTAANGDFQGIVEAFRKAGINVRNWRRKYEPSRYVPKLRGKEGILTFVPIQEDGQWKIANVIEDTDLVPNKN